MVVKNGDDYHGIIRKIKISPTKQGLAIMSQIMLSVTSGNKNLWDLVSFVPFKWQVPPSPQIFHLL